MTDPFEPPGPSHLSASDRAVDPAVRPWLDIAGSRPCAEPAAEERQFGALGGMLSPTDQRAAVRQVRREPRRFVFSRFDLVTEDWEREGIMHVTAIDEVTGLCWTLGAPLWWDSPQYCPAYMSAYVVRSEEHTSELQSLMRISYAVFCLKKKKTHKNTKTTHSNR